MKIHFDLNNISHLEKTAVTTGTFDGVHVGHHKIIERLKEAAKSINGESVLVTFYPHPRLVLFPDDNQIKMLNTQNEKENLLSKTGIDHLVVLPLNTISALTKALGKSLALVSEIASSNEVIRFS